MTGKRTDIVGVLLAGGLSRRMGGGDKGLLELGDKPMLAHVVARLRAQVATMVINANGDPARFSQFGLPVVADQVEGFVGPLAGVLAGMSWTAANVPAARWIATVSTDAPFLPDDLVTRLAAATEEGSRAIVIAASNGELQPVIGLWPVSHADDLQDCLSQGMRKVLHWTDRHGTVVVEFPPVMIGGHPVDPFFNANTPQDLAMARELLAHSTS